MNSISICSLNVNVIRNSKQRKALFKQFKQKRYDIVCLQETFITEEVTGLWEKEWGGGAFIYSLGTFHSLGQTILIRNGFTFEIHTESISNRIIVISFETDNNKTNIINAYAPNQLAEKRIFLNDLSNVLNHLEGEVILC